MKRFNVEHIRIVGEALALFECEKHWQYAPGGEGLFLGGEWIGTKVKKKEAAQAV